MSASAYATTSDLTAGIIWPMRGVERVFNGPDAGDNMYDGGSTVANVAPLIVACGAAYIANGQSLAIPREIGPILVTYGAGAAGFTATAVYFDRSLTAKTMGSDQSNHKSGNF